MASAWGSSWGSAWGDSWGVTAAPVATVAGGGGMLNVGRHKTKDEIRAERERLGILPKPEIVKALAKPVKTLEAGMQFEAADYKAAYRAALLSELRTQQQDDEAIALILLLH